MYSSFIVHLKAVIYPLVENQIFMFTLSFALKL